ncbi:MAG: folylpolyglutamate synthase/dihydrofolate synthase family protein [Candidatus Woesearchaeota archaeon]
MNYNQIINYLENLEKIGTKFGLERVESLLKKLGNPEKSLKIIHVAGTNGKGSVCAMLSAILQGAGYRVGLYTSPHLKDIRERFRINNKDISKKDFIKYFNKTKKYSDKQTYFEFITAMAFLYFREKKADFLVLEVGMGGRLDATNVVKPLVSVITNIELEHTDYLGNTREKIAYEKAGIIKNKVPVITLAKGKALNVIKKIAKSKDSKLIIPKKYNYETNLKGQFQIDNANIAVETINLLNQLKIVNIKKEKTKKSLKKVYWPGRIQFKANVLFDCAHNPAGIKALTGYLKTFKYKKMILIFGVLTDKNFKDMLKQLFPFANKVILTKPQMYRKLDPKIMLKKMGKHKKDITIIDDPKKALKEAKRTAGKNDLILVTGSCYLVGELI